MHIPHSLKKSSSADNIERDVRKNKERDSSSFESKGIIRGTSPCDLNLSTMDNGHLERNVNRYSLANLTFDLNF